MTVLLEAGIVPLIALTLAAGTYAQFTSGVNLIEVYATVTDQRGAAVTNLTAADFRVAEDGSPQTITAFAAGEFPLAVAIGLDRSFSMGSGRTARLDIAKGAARAFIGLEKHLIRELAELSDDGARFARVHAPVEYHQHHRASRRLQHGVCPIDHPARPRPGVGLS